MIALPTRCSPTPIFRAVAVTPPASTSPVSTGRHYHLIVIDESHNFRNHQGQRYERLLNAGDWRRRLKTKVLMLSATPVNTSLIDLRNQIYLMTENRQNSFRESLGVSDIGGVLKRAQTQFKQWESQAPLNGQRE